MPFEPGQSGNPKGKARGTLNKATTEFKEVLNNLLKDSSDKFQGWIDKIAEDDPAKALDLLSKLAEYVYPKLARTEQQILDKEGKPADASWTVNVIDARARND